MVIVRYDVYVQSQNRTGKTPSSSPADQRLPREPCTHTRVYISVTPGWALASLSPLWAHDDTVLVMRVACVGPQRDCSGVESGVCVGSLQHTISQCLRVRCDAACASTRCQPNMFHKPTILQFNNFHKPNSPTISKDNSTHKFKFNTCQRERSTERSRSQPPGHT